MQSFGIRNPKKQKYNVENCFVYGRSCGKIKKEWIELMFKKWYDMFVKLKNKRKEMTRNISYGMVF